MSADGGRHHCAALVATRSRATHATSALEHGVMGATGWRPLQCHCAERQQPRLHACCRQPPTVSHRPHPFLIDHPLIHPCAISLRCHGCCSCCSLVRRNAADCASQNKRSRALRWRRSSPCLPFAAALLVAISNALSGHDCFLLEYVDSCRYDHAHTTGPRASRSRPVDQSDRPSKIRIGRSAHAAAAAAVAPSPLPSAMSDDRYAPHDAPACEAKGTHICTMDR